MRHPRQLPKVQGPIKPILIQFSRTLRGGGDTNHTNYQDFFVCLFFFTLWSKILNHLITRLFFGLGWDLFSFALYTCSLTTIWKAAAYNGGGEPSLFTSRALRTVAMETGLDLSADEGRAVTHWHTWCAHPTCRLHSAAALHRPHTHLWPAANQSGRLLLHYRVLQSKTQNPDVHRKWEPTSEQTKLDWHSKHFYQR